MSCFEVQILEPSGTILEIESCAGDNTNNLTIEQSPTTSNLTISQCMALLPSDINDIIIGQIDTHLIGGSGISLTQQSGLLRISATGLQPSGNYSTIGHQHGISDISGLQIALDNKQPSGLYASGVHFHSASDITNFNSAVSGLLPVVDIVGGTNIAISNSGSIYTVSVSGQLGLTAEQVDDRVSNLLVSGTGITLNYNDNSDTLTINTSGLQPSGNYSIVGHSHPSSDITDFNNSVSGLLIPYAQLNSPNFSGIPTAPTATSGTNTNQIASTAFVRTEISNLVDSAPAVLDTLNELAAALGDDPNFATTVASGLAQKSNIGHTHLSSDITNFNSSVSGLLPVINISAGSGIGIASSSGDFTVSVTGNFGLTSEEVDDRVSGLLIGGSYINLDYNDSLNTLTINASGLQPSGNYSLIGHSHSSSDITDFNNAVSGLIPVKNILSGTGINVSNTSGVYTIEATGSGVLSDQAKSLVTTVFNKTGSPIPKMTAVYIDGGQGDLPTVSLAIATSDTTSAGTYGLTYEAISNMQSGKVIVFGALTGLDTDQFNPTAPQGDANGSIVYLSPFVSGSLTLTKPSAPNHIVAIGTVVRTHQNEGVIEVRVQNGFELEELHNVAISGVSNGQFLQYNSTSGLWVPSSSGNFNTLQLNGTGVVASSGGSSGYLSKFTSSNTIDNSVIYQSGSDVGIGTITPSGKLHIGSGDLRFDSSYGLRWAGGSRLYEQTNALGGVERMLYMPNGDRFEVLSENGVEILMGVHGANSSLANSNRFRKAVGIGANYGSSGTLPFNGLAVQGNVGIGVQSPGAPLHVIGSGIYSTSDSSSIITIDPSGRSIDVNPSAFSDISLKVNTQNIFRGLDGWTGTWADSAITTYFQVGRNAGNTIFTSFVGASFNRLAYSANKILFTNTASNLSTPSGYFTISTNINGGSAGTSGLVIDTTHSSPSANGQSHGALVVTPLFNTVGSNLNNIYGAYIAPRHSGVYTTTNSYGLYVNAATNISGTITNNYAAVFNGGNVGINTTNPLQRLDVRGNVYASGSLGINNPAPSSVLDVIGESRIQGLLYFNQNNTDANDASRNRCSITREGGQQLILRGGSNSLNLSGDGGKIILLSSTVGTEIGGGANNYVMFNPGSSEKARITPSGWLGIGTSTPSGQLHVIGTGIFSQNLLVNGTGVSLVGHTHTSSNITDFNSSVNALIPIQIHPFLLGGM
jgi:hypothetical protein